MAESSFPEARWDSPMGRLDFLSLEVDGSPEKPAG